MHTNTIVGMALALSAVAPQAIAAPLPPKDTYAVINTPVTVYGRDALAAFHAPKDWSGVVGVPDTVTQKGPRRMKARDALVRLPSHRNFWHERAHGCGEYDCLYAPSTEPHVLPVSSTSSGNDAVREDAHAETDVSSYAESTTSSASYASSYGHDSTTSSTDSGFPTPYDSDQTSDASGESESTASTGEDSHPGLAMDGSNLFPLGSTFEPDTNAPPPTSTMSEGVSAPLSTGTSSGAGPLSTGTAAPIGTDGDPKMATVSALPDEYSGRPVRRSLPRHPGDGIVPPTGWRAWI